MQNRYGVHPIILKNKQDQVYWFGADGYYHTAFNGLDGKTYSAEVAPEDWTLELWKRYLKDGISVEGPTPVEELVFPALTFEMLVRALRNGLKYKRRMRKKS